MVCLIMNFIYKKFMMNMYRIFQNKIAIYKGILLMANSLFRLIRVEGIQIDMLVIKIKSI